MRKRGHILCAGLLATLVSGLLLPSSNAALAGERAGDRAGDRGDNRAANISIGSTGGALDDSAVRTVRNIIGQAVGSGTVDTFIVYVPRHVPGAHDAIAREGGLYACAEAGYAAAKTAFAGFVRQLRNVRPRPGTFLTLKLAESCNRTGLIACTLDVRSCPDGSYVSRVPPSCAFASCPGPTQQEE